MLVIISKNVMSKSFLIVGAGYSGLVLAEILSTQHHKDRRDK